MGLYEEMLAKHNYIEIRETDVMPPNLYGVWLGDLILIKRDISDKLKLEVLSEELAHHRLSYGDITDISNFNNRKFENHARRYAKEKLVSLDGIVEAFKQGIHNLYELANFFEVSEGFALESLAHYKQKYGVSKQHGDHLITFEPLRVFKYENFE
ncbi:MULTISPECIES: ImmA/IrrE family metallo-endopeptidase [Staphylococcus]|uniref:ImmA/IrrE family metallo-endopeptidase n=1 Tax=Staphylococcus TaxID=1279 RepID=UPI000213A1C2|nr:MULTISPECIES: ImmA/IrrE family metallo-endopeptidase [Staphylococcus]ARJ18315.1 toxin [Staphylococcus lugdunensis]OHS75448.1 toxin [Staphylococcus sp. HMSC74F12]CCB53283.1 hypothetical phage protein [Staphylococcus lugdunensis N920143]